MEILEAREALEEAESEEEIEAIREENRRSIPLFVCFSFPILFNKGGLFFL